jgi:hypothetical protein
VSAMAIVTNGEPLTFRVVDNPGDIIPRLVGYGEMPSDVAEWIL